MISNISAAWKEDMIENFAHEKRVYINPRGIQYPPIASNNGFTYKQSTYNMGRYHAYQGTATYIHTLTQPMTIDLMLNTPASSTPCLVVRRRSVGLVVTVRRLLLRQGRGVNEHDRWRMASDHRRHRSRNKALYRQDAQGYR